MSAATRRSTASAQGLDLTAGRMIQDSVVNASGWFVTALVSIVVIPYMLRSLGAQLFGVWIVGRSMTGLVGVLDAGLEWTLLHELAARSRTAYEEDTIDLIATYWMASVGIAIVGALVVVALGHVLAPYLATSGTSQHEIASLLTLLGALYVVEQATATLTSMLVARQRFVSSNLVAIAGAASSGAAFITVLRFGGGLTALAAGQFLAAALVFAGSAILIRCVEPMFRLLTAHPRWAVLRKTISFGFYSEAYPVANKVLWEFCPNLLAFLIGPAAAVPYQIGNRFPWALARFDAALDNAFFPGASEQGRLADSVGIREILMRSSRSVMMFATLCGAMMWTIAPIIVRTWIRDVPAGTIAVFRIITAAVVLEALGYAAGQVLRGAGRARDVFAVHITMAFAALPLCWALYFLTGLYAAAWSLFALVSAATLAQVIMACRTCKIRITTFVAHSLRRMWLPVGLAVASGLLIVSVLPAGLTAIVFAALVMSVTAGSAAYMWTATDAERGLIRSAWHRSASFLTRHSAGYADAAGPKG